MFVNVLPNSALSTEINNSIKYRGRYQGRLGPGPRKGRLAENGIRELTGGGLQGQRVKKRQPRKAVKRNRAFSNYFLFPKEV